MEGLDSLRLLKKLWCCVGNKVKQSKVCLLRFAKMKDNFHCPFQDQATCCKFQFHFDKYMIHSQKRLRLCVFFAYRGEMDVKIHKC